MNDRRSGRARTSGARPHPSGGAGVDQPAAPAPYRVALEFEVEADSWVEALVYLVATLEMPTGVRVMSTWTPT
jgi:hypothetical protein